MARIHATTPVSLDTCPGLLDELGFGFSVFDLGRQCVSPESGPELAAKMARALPTGIANSTVVQLVQSIEPHVNANETTNPNLFLCVWGRAQNRGDGSLAACVYRDVAAMDEANALLHEDETIDADQVFTWMKLAKHPLLQPQIQRSKMFRSALAGTMFNAIGLSGGRTDNLKTTVQETTVDVYLEDDKVVLLNDYNSPRSRHACMYHGPSRGMTYYTQSNDTESRRPDNAGGPTCGFVNLCHQGSTYERMTELVPRLHSLPLEYTENRTAACVAIGQAPAHCTPLEDYRTKDEYMVYSDQHSRMFQGSKAYRCRTLATVFPSCYSTENGMIHGVLPLSVANVIAHRQIDTEYVYIANTKENREDLIDKLTVHAKAPYEIMNADTAVTQGGVCVTWKIPVGLLPLLE